MATKISHTVKDSRTPTSPYLGLIPKFYQFVFLVASLSMPILPMGWRLKNAFFQVKGVAKVRAISNIWSRLWEIRSSVSEVCSGERFWCKSEFGLWIKTNHACCDRGEPVFSIDTEQGPEGRCQRRVIIFRQNGESHQMTTNSATENGETLTTQANEHSFLCQNGLINAKPIKNS